MPDTDDTPQRQPDAPAIATQVTLEVPAEVTATASFGRVALTFGNPLASVMFMGDRDSLWRLIGRAGRAMSQASDEDDQ